MADQELDDDDAPSPPHHRRPTTELVALALAIGLAVSLIILTATIGFAVVTQQLPGGIGENATQVLIGWGGGIVGVLGGYVGYVFGSHHVPPPGRH